MVTTTYSFRTDDQDMITEFEDFCTWVFVGVDDIWEQIAPFFKRPGPAPVCSDSELIAMALIGECRGWHMETELLSFWKEYRAWKLCVRAFKKISLLANRLTPLAVCSIGRESSTRCTLCLFPRYC